MFVTPSCDGGFDGRHAEEVPEEHPARDTHALLGGGHSSRLPGGRSGIDAFVTQFAGKATIAGVGFAIDTAQVAEVIIGGTSVNVINGHTFRDWFTAPSDIDGTGSNDIIAIAESTTKLQINCLTMFSYPINLIRIYQYFSSVRIDADTENTAYTVIDIEGYSGLGVDAYELHADAVKEEAPLNRPFTWSNTQNTF